MTRTILDNYSQFSEPAIRDRFVKHVDVVEIIARLPHMFRQEVAGYSAEGRAVHLISCGHGPTKVLLWSQMHGDEATGTMALFDLINFLAHPAHEAAAKELMGACSLYLLPMVNPDGAERFTRRNVQQIDINRDYLEMITPEAQILEQTRARLQPVFGFNLHDQTTLWSVEGSKRPATLSFLAPAYNAELHLNETREKAVKVIADIFARLNPELPGQIGRFDDEYEPRAFGDNFQLNGTSTILIEAGGRSGDPEKQEIRKYYFLSILSGLQSIAGKSYDSQDVQNYFDIPQNTKEIFHILLRNVLVGELRTSIGVNCVDIPNPDASGTLAIYTVADVGDLRFWSAYEIFEEPGLQVHGEVVFEQVAHFDLIKGDQVILSFRDGKLHSKL